MAKAVGILAVVVAHAIPKDFLLWRIINQFHMPLFYFLSGYLHHSKENFRQFLLKKIQSLFVPYFLSVISGYALMVVTGYEPLSIKSILKIVIMEYNGSLFGAPWFIGVLFYALITYESIWRIARYFLKNKKECFVLFVCILCLLVGVRTQFPLRISNIMVAIGFIELGKIAAQKETCKKNTPLIIPVIMLILLILLGKENNVSVSQNTYDNIFLFLFCAAIGIFVTCSICYKVSTKTQFLRSWLGRQCLFVGQNTIGVVLWQFWSFKLVMLLQILYTRSSFKLLSAYPVIYEFTSIPLVILLCLSGVYVSIAWYKLCYLFAKKIRKYCDRPSNMSTGY